MLNHVWLCKPLDCSQPGPSVHRIFQARILKWVAIFFSRGSSWPRDWTHVSCVSCITGGFFTAEPSGKPYVHQASHQILSYEHSLFSSVICKELFWFVLHLAYLYGGLEKTMAPHSSTLAWKIPWTEEPGRLQSMGSLKVGHDWATSLSLFTFMHWRRKWQPTPVFLPGESQGRGSPVGCRLWGHTESDTTEVT